MNGIGVRLGGLRRGGSMVYVNRRGMKNIKDVPR
jgi:hypothetical protein